MSDSSTVYEVGDSVVFYFEKAKSLINDKELKKKDEHYQAFFRRDLRTGEFGIKVSDVHLDIEKKVEAIEMRIADVKEMHQGVGKVEKNHAVAMESYKMLTSQFSVYNTMLIATDEEVQATLSKVILFLPSRGQIALTAVSFPGNEMSFFIVTETDNLNQD